MNGHDVIQSDHMLMTPTATLAVIQYDNEPGIHTDVLLSYNQAGIPAVHQTSGNLLVCCKSIRRSVVRQSDRVGGPRGGGGSDDWDSAHLSSERLFSAPERNQLKSLSYFRDMYLQRPVMNPTDAIGEVGS